MHIFSTAVFGENPRYCHSLLVVCPLPSCKNLNIDWLLNESAFTFNIQTSYVDEPWWVCHPHLLSGQRSQGPVSKRKKICSKIYQPHPPFCQRPGSRSLTSNRKTLTLALKIKVLLPTTSDFICRCTLMSSTSHTSFQVTWSRSLQPLIGKIKIGSKI